MIMKKVLLMLVIGGAIAFTSCSKKGDYVCSCEATSTMNGVSLGTSTSTIEIKDEKEDDAEEMCSAAETSATTGVGNISTTTTMTCSLD